VSQAHGKYDVALLVYEVCAGDNRQVQILGKEWVRTSKCRFMAKNGFCDFSHKDTLILKCRLQTSPPWSCS
jgi:hypothetical protein